MSYARKVRPPVLGEGTVSFTGHELKAPYSLASAASDLRPGPSRIRGSFQADPEVAAEAFRVRDGFLKLEDGARYRLEMLAYTAGSETVYFEMRV